MLCTTWDIAHLRGFRCVTRDLHILGLSKVTMGAGGGGGGGGGWGGWEVGWLGGGVGVGGVTNDNACTKFAYLYCAWPIKYEYN